MIIFIRLFVNIQNNCLIKIFKIYLLNPIKNIPYLIISPILIYLNKKFKKTKNQIKIDYLKCIILNKYSNKFLFEYKINNKEFFYTP